MILVGRVNNSPLYNFLYFLSSVLFAVVLAFDGFTKNPVTVAFLKQRIIGRDLDYFISVTIRYTEYENSGLLMRTKLISYFSNKTYIVDTQRELSQ